MKYEQMSMFDYLEMLDDIESENLNDDSDWNVLEPSEGRYNFPPETGNWQLIECKIHYPDVNEERIERYKYKDLTFISEEKYDPRIGMGEIIAWRSGDAI